MSKCDTVIFSDRAYNAIIRETFSKHPLETGGILLGYIHDSGIWVVMEVVPPGRNGIFQNSYFEYDPEFVNDVGTSMMNQYKTPLQILGLWHRHPGSMDFFSSTDDETNSEFASKNPYGTLSGLVNVDPTFRLTMYHLANNEKDTNGNVSYSTVDVEVGDDIIPENFFELKYVDAQMRDLHPAPGKLKPVTKKNQNVPKISRNTENVKNEFDQKNTPASKTSKKKEVVSQEKNRDKLTSKKRKELYLFGGLIGVLLLAIGFFAGMIIKSWSYNKETKEKQKILKEVIDSQRARQKSPAIQNEIFIPVMEYEIFAQ